MKTKQKQVQSDAEQTGLREDDYPQIFKDSFCGLRGFLRPLIMCIIISVMLLLVLRSQTTGTSLWVESDSDSDGGVTILTALTPHNNHNYSSIYDYS